MEFKRGQDSKDALGLGGYQFGNLRKGAILISKKYFGLSHNGNLRGYTNSAIQVSKGNTFLITHIETEGNKKTLFALKFYDLQMAEDFKRDYWGDIEDNSVGLSKAWKSRAKKIGYKKILYIADITKRKFDYRLDVVKA